MDQVNTNTSLMGEINQGATQIMWDDGTIYVKDDLGSAVGTVLSDGKKSCADISGDWTFVWAFGDGAVTLQQAGCSGVTNAGWEYTVTGETQANIGDTIVGEISADQNTIWWDNGFTYTRVVQYTSQEVAASYPLPRWVDYKYTFI